MTPYAAAHTYFGTKNGVSLFLALHELGNATGLTDFSGGSPAQDAALGLPASEANWDYTVMANNIASQSYVPINSLPSTPQLLDIEALQYLYGANEYGLTEQAGVTSTGLLLLLQLSRNTPACIWVGKKVSGKTTFDFSACGPVTINLSAGSFSSTGEASGKPYNNISIAYRTVIQSAIGGGSGDTTFQSGGTGHYSFTGLGTNNTLDYSADTNGVTINLATHTVLKDVYPPLRYFLSRFPFLSRSSGHAVGRISSPISKLLSAIPVRPNRSPLAAHLINTRSSTTRMAALRLPTRPRGATEPLASIKSVI